MIVGDEVAGRSAAVGELAERQGAGGGWRRIDHRGGAGAGFVVGRVADPHVQRHAAVAQRAQVDAAHAPEPRGAGGGAGAHLGRLALRVLAREHQCDHPTRFNTCGAAADSDVANLGGIDQTVARQQRAVERHLGCGGGVGHKTRVKDHTVGFAVVVAPTAVADEQTDLVGAAIVVGVDESGAGLAGVVPGEGPDHLGLLHRVDTELVVGVVETFGHPQVDAVDLPHVAVDHLAGEQVHHRFVDQTGAHHLRVEAELDHIGGHKQVVAGEVAHRQRGQAFCIGHLAAGHAVDLDFHLQVGAWVQAGVAQQGLKAGAAEVAGVHRQALAVAHGHGHHIALVGVVDAVVVQVLERFFQLEGHTVAVHVGLRADVLWRHHLDRQRGAAGRGVAGGVLEAVLDVPAADRQVGQRHEGVGGLVVEAGHLAAVDHQHHPRVLEARALHHQAEDAHGRRVGANDLGRLVGRGGRVGQHRVALAQALAQRGLAVALAHHLQLDAVAAAGQQLHVEPAQHMAVHQSGEVGPAGAGRRAGARAVDAAVQALVRVEHRSELGGDGLQVLLGLEVVARETGVGRQAQAIDLRQLLGDAVDQRLHLAERAARDGVAQRLRQQRQIGRL